jgi:PPM family protein phosphatase
MTIKLTAMGRTDVGRVRLSNEDAFVIADLTRGTSVHDDSRMRFDLGEKGALLAVSDGLGGAKAGEVASALVIESLEDELSQDGSTRSSDVLLQDAALRANRAVWEAASTPSREGMGATLTALWVRGREAHIAEVGDSRAYLLRDRRLCQVTRDQSYVQLMVEVGAMTPEAAQHSKNNHLVLQAMGIDPEVTIALARVELRRKDILLLCSDGLSNKLTQDEMRDVLLSSERIDQPCQTLVDLANERGGEDNITAIVACVDGDLPNPARGESVSDTFFVLQDFEPMQTNLSR